MRTTKTIEVATCDFCIEAERETWLCVHCGKDACFVCGSNWTLNAETPRVQNGYLRIPVNLFGGPSPVRFSAFVCNDCSHNKLSTVMLRFGFRDHELQHREKTA